MSDESAFDDDSHLVPTVEFEYPESAEPGAKPPDELTEKEMDAATKLFTVVLRWVWQDGMKNPDGLKIRAVVICWIFLKPLRPLNLTQLATGFGLHKQSVGRWVDEFKKAFPRIRTPHMR